MSDDATLPQEEPEHHGEPHAFLAWCVMLGVARPERMVERVLAEVEAEA
jgi:hypothetical protein